MPAERTSPEQLILLNDLEMPPEMCADVLETVVAHHVEGGDSFEIRINALDSTNQRLKWIDSQELAPGTQVEIRFGYLGELDTVIRGEVTALQTELPSSGPALTVVQGFDRLHRFRRGRRTRVLAQVKDSQIAEQIAGDLGLGAEVEDTGIVHEYVLQNNLSDLDFLLERARRIRYEVLVRDQTLVFRQAANDLGEITELEYMIDLMTFSARLSTARQASEVSVRGWSPETKEALIGVARAGDETTRMEGGSIGAAIAEEAFFETAAAIVDIPVYSQAEADQIAKARFNDMAVELIRGEAVAVGNPELRAGATLRLSGVGERFTGLYYITRAEHRVGPGEGYVTRLCVERSGS
ncbi:MAG: phage late control D family protein [bacterium]|nr:phage late control D family protein [bacterium]